MEGGEEADFRRVIGAVSGDGLRGVARICFWGGKPNTSQKPPVPSKSTLRLKIPRSE